MKSPSLIGQRIMSIRYQYEPQNSVGLREFHTYIQLANGFIVPIPVWPTEEFHDDPDEIEELMQKFKQGKEFEAAIRERIEGQKITDIYFRNENSFFSKPAFLELANRHYITELTYTSKSNAPSFRILTKKEFRDEKDLKSYLKDIKGNYPLGA